MMYLALLSLIFIIATAGMFKFYPVFGEPVVQISPTCGPADPGFNIVINANGFRPDSTVNWKLVNSQNQIPLYGYFQSNSMGGFKDVTFADDLKPDNYKIYFGTDDNNDNAFDPGYPTTYVDLTIPCPDGQTVNSAPTPDTPVNSALTPDTQDWAGTCQKIQKYLISDCSMYVGSNGMLTEEGMHTRDCILGGGLLSGAGLLSNLPVLVIIGTLERFSEPANCGGIVDWQSLKNDIAGASVFLRIMGFTG